MYMYTYIYIAAIFFLHHPYNIQSTTVLSEQCTVVYGCVYLSHLNDIIKPPPPPPTTHHPPTVIQYETLSRTSLEGGGG